MKIKVKLLTEGQHFALPSNTFPPGKRWMDNLQYEITDQVFRQPRYYHYYTVIPTPAMGDTYVVVKPKGISLQYAMDSQYLVALPEDTLVDLIFHIRPYPPRNPVRPVLYPLARTQNVVSATAVGTARVTGAITPPTEPIGHSRVVYWHPNDEAIQAVNYSNEQSQSLQREVARLRANYALHGDARPLASIPASWFEAPVSIRPEPQAVSTPPSLSDSCRRAEAVVAELEARTANLERQNVRVAPSGWRIEQGVVQRPNTLQEEEVRQHWYGRDANLRQGTACRSPSPGDE